MNEIRTVLVPVDLQQHADTLAGYALHLAAKLGARVTFVHVRTEVEYLSVYDSSTFEAFEEKNRREAAERLRAFGERWQARGWEGETVLLEGEAADAIVAHARDTAVDLIIMATHGVKGLEKILLGSVADRVVKQAPCPVLLFNPYRHLAAAPR